MVPRLDFRRLTPPARQAAASAHARQGNKSMRMVLIGAAVAVFGGCAPVTATGQTSQLPIGQTSQLQIESEIVHLRDECRHLGEELLAVKVLPEVKSQVSHYNQRDNSCYVLVTLRTEKYQNHALYDGRSSKLIALAEIGTMFKKADQSGLFMEGGGAYDSVCVYLSEKMETKDLCADLHSWWLLKQREGYKPTCEALPCR